MSGYRLTPVWILLALVYPVWGQSTAGVVSSTSKPTCNCAPHAGPAYTAEFKITSVQTLANGTSITRETTETDARDSEGRSVHLRTETTPDMGRAAGTSANANDPVEGTRSTWDSRTKKAHVTKLPPKDQRHGCWANDSGSLRMSWFDGTHPAQLAAAENILPAPRPTKPEVEDLGTTTIQGVEAHGTRSTTIIPAGEIGNDQPIVSTSEHWMSRDLGLVVREVSDDPRMGKRIWNLLI